jgi:hypothetical protein
LVRVLFHEDRARSSWPPTDRDRETFMPQLLQLAPKSSGG